MVGHDTDLLELLWQKVGWTWVASGDLFRDDVND